MKLPALLSLLLLSAILVRADDSTQAPPKKKRKATKGAVGLPANRAPVKAKKQTGVDPVAQTASHPGGTEITDGGESVLGAGIKRANPDKAPGANASLGGGNGGGGGAARAPGAPADAAKPANSFLDMKTFTANSPTGPWIEGSPACNTGKVYTRTTGVNRANPPKGCASPAAADGCLNYANHRVFLDSEWVDNKTIQTVVDGAAFREGAYALYMSYSAKEIQRVGTMQLKSCATTVSCRWESTTPVIGPCDGPGTGSCTTANRGATGFGCGGNWACVCK